MFIRFKRIYLPRLKKYNMKKIVTGSLILIAAFSTSFAQQNKCGSDILLKKEMARNPQIAAQHEEFERGLADWKANKPIGFREGEKYIIPTVFHVIHEGGSENISKTQIEDQIRILNEAFRGENSSRVNTPAPFLAVAGDIDVEFRLAKLDPQGNCTEGITRTYSNKTNNASNENGVKDLIDWNCYSYFNVWVVKSIGLEGGVIGYAQFPASGLCGTDGVVLDYKWCGSVGTGIGEGNTLVHEAGHWLGLRHIWGDEICGTDAIDDTPIHRKANFGVCYNDFPYIPDTLCAGTDTINGEMMVNYMDYSPDQCQNMFTVGQCEVMDFVLAGTTGSNGVRSYLWSDENQWATGTHDDYTEVACAPIADFIANKRFACTGVTINFDDNSYNGSITGRNWSFPGGNPETSTAASPNVTYANPGVYQVSLTVNNGTGTDTETKSAYIYIYNDAAQQTASWVYFEDFESQSDFDNNWVVINPDNTSNKWEIAGGLSTPSGGGVLRVRNLGNTPTEYEEVVSPSYNLSNLQAPVILKYFYSGATTTELGDHTTPFDFTVEGDAFKVYYSTTCGQSWTQIPQLALSDVNLINAGLYSSFYIPDAQSIWSEKQVTLPAGAANSDNVKFKFSYEIGNGYGNNFYLDGIHIVNTTGAIELNSLLGVQVFPNPSNGLTRISLTTPETGKLSLNLIDVLGREVARIYNGSVNAGEQVYNFDVNNIDAGVYFMQINYNDKTSALKLVVQ